MKLKPDPKIDAKTQAEIQKHMEDLVLETSKYPEIVFRSSKIEKSGEEWKVEGQLTLHGVTKPVSLIAHRSGDGYAAKAMLRQTDYGIKPISVAGVVKVKNELDLEFAIFPKK